MRTFARKEIVHYATSDRSGYVAPCGSVSIPFTVEVSSEPVCHRIRLVGETDYFWMYRTEWGAPYAIAMAIDDALTKGDTFGEAFALEYPCRGDEYPRNAYAKLYASDLRPGAKAKFSIAVKAVDFDCTVEAGAVLEIYFAKKGRHPNDVFDAPDKIVKLDFPRGTYDWRELSTEFVMPSTAVCCIVRTGVCGGSGRILSGSPRLSFEGGDSVIPPLAPTQTRREQFNYLGENLSRRDWLECAVSIDGREIFRGEKYSCIVRRPEYSFDAGVLEPGEHVFTLKLLNDYSTAVGFVLQGLELHTLGNHEFEFIGAPETVREGETFAALIRTNVPEVTVSAEGVERKFAETGLHAFRFAPIAAGKKSIEFVSANHRDAFDVQCVPSGGDLVLQGTGDDVYIPQDIDDAERYLEWYVANHIGNCICYRHSYRWDGARGLNTRLWKHIIPLLNDLCIHYTLMVDGREVPGMTANPPDELLKGPYYVGRRSHENDGSLCYWGNALWGTTHFAEPYGDILSSDVNPDGIQPHVRPKRFVEGEEQEAVNPLRDVYKTWWFFDPCKARDMKEAAEYFVSNLADARGDSTRHSGPSTFFRYFFQAGYKCLLAEQMYGPEAVILSALRGASRAYGTHDFGTHLATQWSSSPLDAQEHAERLFLSLAESYIHGATDINIEEGLWRMESDYADYDRFSHNCVIHREANDRFRRFMEANPRCGEIVTPVAALQGRYDGWRCFGRGNTWRNLGDEWLFGPPEESFDLLSLYFPRAVFDSIGAKPCENKPYGWYTGTPFGCVDIAPIETKLEQYGAAVMLGWHTYQKGDGGKLLDFVKNGGDLLLCRRHLSMSLKKSEAPKYAADDVELKELLGDNWLEKNDISCNARRVGQGVVRFFATDLWPAEAPLREAYEREMKSQALEAVARQEVRGWFRGNDDVEFAAYDLSDGGRRFYLLNIRWWDRKEARATYVLNGSEREITVPYGQIVVFQ
ncbi:MAG: hypothetical protein MJ106_03075 [Lentisphaeria bacterium]|nr:hypothetical protein [Lentisphaeria bacterium]